MDSFTVVKLLILLSVTLGRSNGVEGVKWLFFFFKSVQHCLKCAADVLRLIQFVLYKPVYAVLMRRNRVV